jgi:hypothetical protein
MTPLTTAEIWHRFFLAAALTTAFCVPLGLVLLRLTGVPSTYPPLLPQQVIAGTVGGALLVTLGYWLLTAFIRDVRHLQAVFLWAGAILLVASFHLPYRLSYTTSVKACFTSSSSASAPSTSSATKSPLKCFTSLPIG